ncbi:MAG: YraN family protein [Aurantibacter sp.]
MKSRRNIGSIGEGLAVNYLEQQGYQVLEKNYRRGRGEIDVIVIKEDLLVFVEVKTKSRSTALRSEQKVRWHQKQKIRTTATRYLSGCNWYGRVRFDVILVYLDPIGSIRHLPGYLS